MKGTGYMKLNVFRKRPPISGFLLFFLLLTLAASAEEKIDCSYPPGPQGEIFCASDQIPICDVDGKKFVGYCFDRGNLSIEELKTMLLFRILGDKFSQNKFNLNEYDNSLRDGRLEIENRVVTFTPISQ
jgi:hypothetical protein